MKSTFNAEKLNNEIDRQVLKILNIFILFFSLFNLFFFLSIESQLMTGVQATSIVLYALLYIFSNKLSIEAHKICFFSIIFTTFVPFSLFLPFETGQYMIIFPGFPLAFLLFEGKNAKYAFLLISLYISVFILEIFADFENPVSLSQAEIDEQFNLLTVAALLFTVIISIYYRKKSKIKFMNRISESVEDISDILSKTSDVIITLDPNTFDVVNVNDICIEVFNFRIDGKTDHQLHHIHPKLNKKFIKNVSYGNRNGKETEICLNIKNKEFWFNVRTTNISLHKQKELLLLRLVDITKHKIKATDLADVASKITALQEMVNVGYAYFDINRKKIEFSNSHIKNHLTKEKIKNIIEKNPKEKNFEIEFNDKKINIFVSHITEDRVFIMTLDVTYNNSINEKLQKNKEISENLVDDTFNLYHKLFQDVSENILCINQLDVNKDEEKIKSCVQKLSDSIEFNIFATKLLDREPDYKLVDLDEFFNSLIEEYHDVKIIKDFELDSKVYLDIERFDYIIQNILKNSIDQSNDSIIIKLKSDFDCITFTIEDPDDVFTENPLRPKKLNNLVEHLCMLMNSELSFRKNNKSKSIVSFTMPNMISQAKIMTSLD